MTGPYMGSTGDQFAGADPRELERLRAEVEADGIRIREALEWRDQALARIEELEQALREVLSAYDDDRQTWKQRAAQMMLFVEVALHPDQRETCTCKVRVGAAGEQGQRLSDGCPVHPDQRETT